MGIDYKLTLKPALNSFADDIKKSSMEKLEELISLQQKASENAARLEGKRNHVAEMQSRIDDVSDWTVALDGGGCVWQLICYIMI